MIIIDMIRGVTTSKLFDNIFQYIKKHPLIGEQDESFGSFQIDTHTKLDIFLNENNIKSECAGWSTTEIEGKEFLCFGLNLIETVVDGYGYESELEIDFCDKFVYINYRNNNLIIPYSDLSEDDIILTLRYGRFLFLDV